MNLIWLEFERRFRKLYRTEVERTPGLRQRVRGERRLERNAPVRLLGRVAVAVLWNVLFLNFALRQDSVPLTAAVISLWSAGTALRWGQRWFQQFYGSSELIVLSFLPLNDREIFRFQLRQYLSAAAWVGWELLLAYGVLIAVALPAGLSYLAVAATVAAQTLLIVAIAMHAAAHVHMVPLALVGGLLRFTAAFILAAGVRQLPWIEHIIRASEWGLPSGWVNYALLRGSEDPVVLCLLVPVAGIIYLARFSFERLRAHYSLEGLELMPTQNLGLGSEHEELTDDWFGSRPGPTEIEERLASRSFLLGVNWAQAGPLEKFAARWLTPEEKVITEFLVAQDPGWTRGLKLSVWIWLISTASVLALGHLGGTLIFFAGYILFSASVPLFGGEWRGMRQSPSGGVLLPGYALYPIGFNPIARILCKVSLVRIAAGAPLILSFAALAAYKLGYPPQAGLAIGAKGLGLLLAIQPLLILLPISSTTDDSRRLRPWVTLVIIGPGILLLLACGVAIFMAKSGWLVLLAYLLAAGVAATLFILYRQAYRRGKFDLVSERTSTR